MHRKPTLAGAGDLELMRLIDEQYLRTPFYGARKMAVVLTRSGHRVGRKRVTRLMRVMGIEAIYRKPNLSRRGGKRTHTREAYESRAAFKEGQRFRAGIEGRISVLFRGMKRRLAEGPDRFELWVGAAVLAKNLMRIAAMLTKPSSRRRKFA